MQPRHDRSPEEETADIMRAIGADHPGGPEVLHERELPAPELQPGCVQVAAHAAGINFHDVRERQDSNPTPIRFRV
jgi:NADPH:quinone reductase